MNYQLHRPERPFTIRREGEEPRKVWVKGRDRRALEALIDAGPRGCTSFHNPAPRWPAYIFNLSVLDFAIDSLTEAHGGPFAGHHARCVLRDSVTPKGDAA